MNPISSRSKNQRHQKSSTALEPSLEKVAIGKLGKAWGLRGALVCHLYNQESDFLHEARFVYLKTGLSFEIKKVLSCRLQGSLFVIHLEGLNSPEEAKLLTQREVFVEKENLPRKEGEYFVYELKGCEALNSLGQSLGTVNDVVNYGASDLLELVCVVEGRRREYLIPLAGDFLKQVDLKNRRLVIDPPEGLLEDV